MEAAREAYDAFLSHYPYCYGYWRKYADYEKRKGNKKKCEEVSIASACARCVKFHTLTYNLFCNPYSSSVAAALKIIYMPVLLLLIIVIICYMLVLNML